MMLSDAKDIFFLILKIIGILLVAAIFVFSAIVIAISVKNYTGHNAEILILTEDDYNASKDEWFNTFDAGQPVKNSIREKKQEKLIAHTTYYCVIAYSGVLGVTFGSPTPSGFMTFADDAAVDILDAEPCLHMIKHNSWEKFFNITNGDVNDITINSTFDNEKKTAAFDIETGAVSMRMRFAVKFIPQTDGEIKVNSQIDFNSSSQTYTTGSITMDSGVTFHKSVNILNIKTRYASAADCPNGDIKEEFLFDNPYFTPNHTYYAVTELDLQALRDNDGSGILKITFEIDNPFFECSLSEASSGDFTQVSNGNGTKITLSVKLPPLASEVKRVRAVIKITPVYICTGLYKLSFEGDEITCFPKTSTPELLTCMPR